MPYFLANVRLINEYLLGLLSGKNYNRNSLSFNELGKGIRMIFISIVLLDKVLKTFYVFFFNLYILFHVKGHNDPDDSQIISVLFLFVGKKSPLLFDHVLDILLGGEGR